MMYLSGARHSRAPEDRLQKMTQKVKNKLQ